MQYESLNTYSLAWIYMDNRIKPDKNKTWDEFKRLNVDIPEELYRILKYNCYIRGAKMSDVIRELLMERFEKNNN